MCIQTNACLDLVCVVVQIVQNQEQEAAEMAEQIQELEGDRQQLQVANEDLDLAEDRVSPPACHACPPPACLSCLAAHDHQIEQCICPPAKRILPLLSAWYSR